MRKSILLLAILLVLTMAACNTQQQDYYEKNSTPTIDVTTQQPVYTYDPDWTPMPQPTNSKGELVEGNPYDYINPERLFNIGEWVEIGGVYFRVNKVEVRKELKEINLDKMYMQNDTINEQGTLFGNYSYVAVNVDARNETNEAIDLCLGSLNLIEQIKDSWANIATVRYIDPIMYDENVKHSLYYLFQPGEEVNFNLYSLGMDKFLDDDSIYLKIPSSIIPTVPVEEDANYKYDAYIPINKDKSEVDVYADYHDPHNDINPERLYNIGETAEIKDVQFRIHTIEKGKELKGIAFNQIEFSDYLLTLMDDKGTFLNDRNYLTVNMNIKNASEQKIELCLGVIYLYDEEDGSSRIWLAIIDTKTKQSQQMEFYSLDPGEEININAYFILKDDELLDEKLFIRFPITMGLQNLSAPESSYDYDIYVPINKDKSEVDVYA